MVPHIFNVLMAEEGADWHHQPSFTHEETDLLICEVQACNHQIYDTSCISPRCDDVELAKDKVINILMPPPLLLHELLLQGGN